MKTARCRLSFAVLLLILTALISAQAQITPSQDAYTSSALPTTNYGAATTLGVASTAATIQTSYILFDLSSVPGGYTGANVVKATLKLYVNTAPAAGSFNIDYITSSWGNKTITYNNPPTLGGAIASNIALAGSNAKSYLLIDVTSAVQAWLNGAEANYGIALVANSPLNSTFDSNESTSQSHPPELDVVFSGTITGVNTAAGSGLTGGGNSGTLSLSLLTSCSSGQTLNWSGAAWGCANPVGGGTVTSVGLGAPASDFTVSGSPITTSGTLNLAWTVPPTNISTANAIVKRDSTGSFNATNINASGQITIDSSASLSPILAIARSVSAAAIVGSSVFTGAGYTYGVQGSTLSSGTGSSGLIGLDHNSAPTSGSYTAGVLGHTYSSYGVGVLGIGTLSNNGQANIGFSRAGVWGDDATGTGVAATSDGGTAVSAINTSTSPTLKAVNNSTGRAVFAFNSSTSDQTMYVQNNTTSPTGVIFRAEAPQVSVNGSTAFCQITTRGGLGCTGDVYQNSPANGLVKALVYFDPAQPAGSQIVRCFNSALAEPAASTPPCGFNPIHLTRGINQIDFGFTVNNRFAQVTAVYAGGDTSTVAASFYNQGAMLPGPTQLDVVTFYTNVSSPNGTDTPFYLTVF